MFPESKWSPQGDIDISKLIWVSNLVIMFPSTPIFKLCFHVIYYKSISAKRAARIVSCRDLKKNIWTAFSISEFGGEVLGCLHLCVCFDLKKWRHTICYAYYYYVSYFLHIHKVVTSRRMFNFWTWEVIFYSWTSIP